MAGEVRVHRFLIPVMAILLCALLLAGCSDRESQPPASVRTLAPTPVTTTTIRTITVPTTVPEPAPPLEAGSISQAGAILQVAGPVLGFRGTGGSYLDLITFDLVKIPSADPVDMEHVQVTLTLHDETTGLRYEIPQQKNGDRDTILEDGETFSLAVPVMPDYRIYRGDTFEIRILVPGSAQLIIRSRGPAVMEAENILAEP